MDLRVRCAGFAGYFTYLMQLFGELILRDSCNIWPFAANGIGE
jgi:hypothetical protein